MSVCSGAGLPAFIYGPRFGEKRGGTLCVAGESDRPVVAGRLGNALQGVG